ncbi:MAG: response regulator [Desulfobacterales bacterium]|nr:response regulator [Desulfobacterales bacterium]
MAEQRKIMLVDDDPEILSLLSLKLEKKGIYEVISTSKGAEAANLATMESPDIILLDIEMPDMQGDEVASSLLESEATKHIPILFLSSMITKSDVAMSGGIIGGRQMASKSGSVKELILRIESILDKPSPG